jgi:hypothetical protein
LRNLLLGFKRGPFCKQVQKEKRFKSCRFHFYFYFFGVNYEELYRLIEFICYDFAMNFLCYNRKHYKHWGFTRVKKTWSSLASQVELSVLWRLGKLVSVFNNIWSFDMERIMIIFDLFLLWTDYCSIIIYMNLWYEAFIRCIMFFYMQCYFGSFLFSWFWWVYYIVQQSSLGVAGDGIMTSELLEKQYLEKRTADIGNANETKNLLLFYQRYVGWLWDVLFALWVLRTRYFLLF